jgi:HD-GYP domain-containing protein (c-di-GMP phosphodiesterase class II)
MTFPRPYATQMTKAQAISELTRCAGTQFDPQVVAVLTGVLAEQADGQPLASAASANTASNEQQTTT